MYGHENKWRAIDMVLFSYNKLSIISFKSSEEFPKSLNSIKS